MHGVSTRKVDDLMKALALDGVSKSEVSRICGELEPLVEVFRTRPLPGAHPQMWSTRCTTKCGSLAGSR